MRKHAETTPVGVSEWMLGWCCGEQYSCRKAAKLLDGFADKHEWCLMCVYVAVQPELSPRLRSSRLQPQSHTGIDFLFSPKVWERNSQS